jgi:hypothetical protein
MPMSHYRIVQHRDDPNTALGAPPIACPKCSARFVFCRSGKPFIDACGFESYTLECHECGASLAGIVDPFDETLLISEMAA